MPKSKPQKGAQEEDHTKIQSLSSLLSAGIGLQGTRKLARKHLADLLTRVSRCRHKLSIGANRDKPSEDIKTEFGLLLNDVGQFFISNSQKSLDKDVYPIPPPSKNENGGKPNIPVLNVQGGAAMKSLETLPCSMDILTKLELLLDTSESGGLQCVDPALCHWLQVVLKLSPDAIAAANNKA